MEICQPVESDRWTWPRSEQQSACLVVQFHFRSESEQPPGTRGCVDTQEGTCLGTFYKQLNRPGAGGTGKNGVPTWDNCMPARQQGKENFKISYLVFGTFRETKAHQSFTISKQLSIGDKS